jgi:flagellar protein FlaI
MAKLRAASPVASRIMRRMKEGYLTSLRRQQAQIPSPEGMAVHYVPYPQQYPGLPPAPRPPEKRPAEGIEISGELQPVSSIPLITGSDKSSLMDVNVVYPLIPRQPAQGERVYAYANIQWNRRLGELVYYVVEPRITQYDSEAMEATKKLLEEKLDIDFFKLGEIKAKSLLNEETQRILGMNPNIGPDKQDVLRYYLERDIVGLGKIEPLMNDPNIEDISCDGINIPIYVYHRNPNLGSIKTNIVFTSKEELSSFVVKMSQRCKKSISIAEPLLDASLPDGSRMQATLGTDIARKGSNFTIRKFSEQPLTPCHMLRYGTLNSTQLAYLWLAIENGQSMLISGGTATGKTSMLNALSLFIKPSIKIVSIEDTPELRLPHPHWIPEVARTPISIEGTRGEVSLFDLLKASLRQRPDYIVMGEVRGKEAFVLFQQMATGHSSLATIHAASMNQLVDRLTTPPISLPPSLIENVNIIIFLVLSRLRDKYVRRANDILEVTGVREGRPETKAIFSWSPADDSFKIVDKSTVLMNISKRQGLGEQELKDELARRRSIIEWMYEQKIFDYREVARVISTYYSSPEKVMNVVGERL